MMERQDLEFATRTLSPLADHCRACGARELFPILELGAQPLASGFVTRERLDQPEARFPLDLAFCGSCSLLQILDFVPTETLFGDYPYYSSVIEPLVRQAGDVATREIAQEDLGKESLVVEIAPAEGYLLEHYRRAGIPTLAIEPVRRAEDAADADGFPHYEFFGSLQAAKLWWDGVRPNVIHANNVIAQQPSLNGFVAGIAMLLEAGGVAIIEAPYVKALLEERQFDTIYHEHLCYYSMTVLDRLFAAHGVTLERVEHVDDNSSSLRVFARRRGLARPDGSVEALLEEDRHYGLNGPSPYLEFARAVRECKSSLRGLLADVKAQGARIAAYGAVPQGNTLLNTYGIGAETLDWVADGSPEKQGLFMPGSRLEIRPPSALLEEMPGYCVLLSWRHADEILERHSDYRNRGGRFILPIPEPRIV
jgi:C-methyltransferase-like protein/putative zinc binding protein/methyltransferase family protein